MRLGLVVGLKRTVLIIGCGISLLVCNQYFPFTDEPADLTCNCSATVPSMVQRMTTDSVLKWKKQVPSLESKQIVSPTRGVKKKLGPTFLLIMVPILFSSTNSRNLIRDTWYKGFRDTEHVMLRYIMGVNTLNDSQMKQLHEENKAHGDLVFLENFTEGIWALTNKTIAIMKWATENVEFTYLMKCDDDTFVYVNNAVEELKRRPTTKKLYYGVMAFNQKPIHSNQSKWRDFEWNLSKKYTPFARGGCYILSEDLVQLLARQSHHLKRHPLEDVAVGSWLAPFDYERRDDDLICFGHHPCNKDFRVAYIFYGKSDHKLRKLFNSLLKETLKIHVKPSSGNSLITIVS